MASTPAQNDSLNLIFNKILSDLKNSSPAWEDFLSKSSKLHSALRNVLQCLTIFWESFQKVADFAADAQGATKEIGVSLTRLCMRQRLVESKIKNLNHHLIASLTNPVQDKMEEWKRFVCQLEKDRLKETKKAKGEYKKAIVESVRLQKKAQKRGSMRGLGSLQNEVEGALKNAADKFSGLQFVESLCLRRAMTHERERFCFLFTSMKPLLECQISLLPDITSLDELMKSLVLSTSSPNSLPVESEEVIRHIIDPDYDIPNKNNCNLSGNTVFSSGFGSRKSSVASLNSHQSLSSGSGPSTKKEDDSNLRDSHISMTSSIQEPSGISGDYRVSDDDSKNVGDGAVGDDSDDEDIEYDEEDDDSDEEAKTPSSPSTSLWNEKINHGSDTADKYVASRHTVSGASAFSRPALSAVVFEPIDKGGNNSDASLSKMDQSKQLYPNQAIPLPVYTNLKELTNAAQRKFSMSKPSFCENSSVMLVSMTTKSCGESDSPSVEHHVSQYGSKTPGIRRMTLPEVALQEKKSKEIKSTESHSQRTVPDQILEVRQQSSTLTRTVEHHYNCSQVSSAHHRSNSANDKGRIPQRVPPTPTKSTERRRESHYSTSLTKDLLVNELNQQIHRQKSSPACQEPVTIWTDIDPDLPMPPPPSTAEEEIRLASMPLSPHADVILRQHSSPNRK